MLMRFPCFNVTVISFSAAMTDPGSASELLHLFEDYEFEEPQASWRKNKYEKEVEP